jgi:hypothetical protein
VTLDLSDSIFPPTVESLISPPPAPGVHFQILHGPRFPRKDWETSRLSSKEEISLGEDGSGAGMEAAVRNVQTLGGFVGSRQVGRHQQIKPHCCRFCLALCRPVQL